MAKHIDLRELPKVVGIADILKHYGHWESMRVVNAESGEIRGRCMFHDDKRPSWTANVHKFPNGWQCYGCGAKGNIYTFVIKKEGINTGDRGQDVRRAGLLIDGWFPDWREWKPGESRSLTAPGPERTGSITEEPINPPLTFELKHLEPAHSYLLETRGISVETIQHFGAGFNQSTRGITSGLITIPIHNEHGELVAYTGRWPAEEIPTGETKYKFPPQFRASHVVYNLHRVALDTSDELVLVEGFFDVWTLWEEGITDVVALMGTALSEVQQQLILDRMGREGKILVAFDDDPPGRKGAEACLARLGWHVLVRAAPFQKLVNRFR
jgi:DNA primase